MAVLLMGCGYSPASFHKGVVITRIEVKIGEPTTCFYYTDDTYAVRTSNEAQFCGPCSQFNVGDTLYLTKKP